MRKLLFPLLVAACSSSPASSPGDAGDEGPVSTLEGGTGCPTDQSPKEDKCVVDERYGVFVSASLGSPMGDGSRTKPLQTIQAGIDAAKSTKRNVYVCAEQYKETLVLANAVHVYGYMDCANGWAPVNARAVVSPATSPVARADGAQQTTRIEGFDVRAPSVAMTPGASSIAFVLVSSSGIRFANMTIHADDAGKGSVGKDAVQLGDSGTAKNGGPAQGGFACNTMSFSCQGGPTVQLATQNTCTGKMGINGGTGGGGGNPSLYLRVNGMWQKNNGATNGAAQPMTAITAQGGIAGGTGPQPGTPGANGMNGAPGSTGFLDPTKLFVTPDGTAGKDGAPGQGGGGGAGLDLDPGNMAAADGTRFWGGAGGAGGAGGCPGLAAEPGTGGGASIAILAIDSPFTIDVSNVTTGKGGDGGAAGLAGTSTLGGTGGPNLGNVQGGNAGGSGGLAGASGNGAGGPSLGIAYRGVKPVAKSAAMILPGMGGKGVAQRVVVDLAVIPASPDGTSAAMFEYGN